jgi:hypothetical protein
MVEIVANLHMHTPYSDGTKQHREIAADAAKSGLDAVIVTDHNLYVRGVDGTYDGVLVLVGEEVHDVRRRPQANHCLIYGAGCELSTLAARPQALIDEAIRLGGMAFFAHPFERASPISPDYIAIPWLDWDVRNSTGIELWNAMTEFKSRLWSWPAAAVYAFLPSWALFGPFDATLRKWDELLAGGKRVVVIGNSDAHGTIFHLGPIKRAVLPYDYLFRCVNTHLLVDQPLIGELERDRKLVYDALRAGRAFVAYDRAAAARGFTFTARTGAQRAVMGDEIKRSGVTRFEVRCPSAGWIRLLRDGNVVASRFGRALDYTSIDPGVYRVEVKRFFRLWMRGWIYSNPIYVR